MVNTVRIGVISVCVVVGASGYGLLRDAATDDVRPAPETRAPGGRHVASDRDERRDVVPASDARTSEKVSQPEFEPDASDLRQPSPTLDEVFDAVNADIGPDGEYVDREALAAALSSDPELSRLLDESEF
jgi:hypothetical protein